MAMQSGKGAAKESGADPSLTADKADEIAASFRPAWDVEEPGDDAPPPAPAALGKTAPAIVASPVIFAGGPPVEAPRAPEPSSETIEPEQVLDVAPAPKPAPAPPVAAAAPAAAAPAPKPVPASTKAAAAGSLATAGAAAMKPVAVRKPAAAPIVAPAKDPFRPDSSDDIVVPKKSKGTVFVVVGLAIAAGVGLLLKFYMADDSSKTPTAPTAQVASPAPTKEEIPPPTPNDEPASTAAAATAAPKTEPAKAEPATPEPAKAEPAKAEPAKPEPAKVAAKAPTPPRPVAAAPHAPRTAPAPAAPKPEPKTAPKPAGGAIVRDNPF